MINGYGYQDIYYIQYTVGIQSNEAGKINRVKHERLATDSFIGYTSRLPIADAKCLILLDNLNVWPLEQ